MKSTCLILAIALVAVARPCSSSVADLISKFEDQAGGKPTRRVAAKLVEQPTEKPLVETEPPRQFPGRRAPPADDSLCRDPNFDLMVKTQDGTRYLFKGQNFWVLPEDEDQPLAEGQRIADHWAGLPDDLDAAFTLPDGLTYFFKGAQFWVFLNKEPQNGGKPEKITSRFGDINLPVDTVMYASTSDTLLVFKDNVIEELRRRDGGLWRPSYSQLLPKRHQQHKLLAAFVDRDFNFFFDDQTFFKDLNSQAAGQSTAQFWFGCQ